MAARSPGEDVLPRPSAGSGRGERVEPRGGIYVLLVELPASRRLGVGRRRRVELAPGWYCYVGSAQRALRARLRRHVRRHKVRRWHIDGLTSVASPVGAWVARAPGSMECALAGALARRGEVVAGFGASDCRCPGHLVRFDTRRRAAAAVGACRRERGWRLVWWSGSVDRAKIFGKKG